MNKYYLYLEELSKHSEYYHFDWAFYLKAHFDLPWKKANAIAKSYYKAVTYDYTSYKK